MWSLRDPEIFGEGDCPLIDKCECWDDNNRAPVTSSNEVRDHLGKPRLPRPSDHRHDSSMAMLLPGRKCLPLPVAGLKCRDNCTWPRYRVGVFEGRFASPYGRREAHVAPYPRTEHGRLGGGTSRFCCGKASVEQRVVENRGMRPPSRPLARANFDRGSTGPPSLRTMIRSITTTPIAINLSMSCCLRCFSVNRGFGSSRAR